MQFPLRALKPGQSFAVPPEKKKALCSAVANFSKRHPEYKFTVRKLADGRVRVWRVALQTDTPQGARGVVKPSESRQREPASRSTPTASAERSPPISTARTPALPGNGKVRTVRGGRY